MVIIDKRLQKFDYSSIEDTKELCMIFIMEIYNRSITRFWNNECKMLLSYYMGGQYLIIYSDEIPIPM